MSPNAKISVRTQGGEVHVAVTDEQGTREKSFTPADWPKLRAYIEKKTGKVVLLKGGCYVG